jgi:hypothetical protein
MYFIIKIWEQPKEETEYGIAAACGSLKSFLIK